jgi:Dolichyl-phosphate-mannose-protein mannosyltransferase
MHLRADPRRLPWVSDAGRAEPRRLAWASVDERALPLAAVAIITVIALILRWIGAHESLYGDELRTYYEATSSSLSGVFHRMKPLEANPPLYFVLAWLSAKLGDPATLINLPSALAGAAAVPVIYLIGDAIAGRRAGITAAALFAVLPFAVFYGSEARAYGLILLLVPLSTLALLRALESKQGRWWWALYAVASALSLYSHYVAGLAIAAQAGWALITQRDRRREILIANAAVGVAFLPLLSVVNNNTRDLAITDRFNPLTLKLILTDPLRVIFGHPFAPASQVPGNLSIVIACLVGTLIVVGLIRPSLFGGTPETPSWRASGSLGVPRLGWLLVSMTAGTLGLTLAYSVLATYSIYWDRDLIAILPYFCLICGVACAALQERPGLVAAAALVLAALLGSLRMLITYPRPDTKAAAEAIADKAPPGTPVVEPWRFGHDPASYGQKYDVLQQSLAIYLGDPYPIVHPANASEWPKGGDVYVVEGGMFPVAGIDVIARSAGARLVQTQYFDGVTDPRVGLNQVRVERYSTGREPGKTVVDRRNAFRTYLDQHPAQRERFQERFRAYLEQHPAAREQFRRQLQAQQGSP